MRLGSCIPSAGPGISVSAPLVALGSVEVVVEVAVKGPWLTVSPLHISVRITRAGFRQECMAPNGWSHPELEDRPQGCHT
jgi:hypothetical protein